MITLSRTFSVSDDWKVIVIGAGGNGSHFVRNLATMVHASEMLNYCDIEVEVYDDDDIENHNVGRQCFNEASIGFNKAVNICSRVNAAYGFNFKANNIRYDPSLIESTAYNRLYVLAVDSPEFRVAFYQKLKSVNDANISTAHRSLVLDMGNADSFGQVVFTPNISLCTEPYFLDYIENLKALKGNDSVSCSHIDSIKTQGLFVNSTIAVVAANIFWNFLFYNPVEIPLVTYLDSFGGVMTSVKEKFKYSEKCQSPLI